MSDDLSELGQAALSYIEKGFAIIPLKPKSKVPMTKHGLNDWTDNKDMVTDFWRKYPDANIGIVCGMPSHGLCVLDLDVDEDKDKDGYRTMRTWTTSNGSLPDTVTAITGGGGMHLLYRVSRSIQPSVNAKLGVDIRCDGSYIVAPPSIHPNGRRYEWETAPEDMPVADATAEVYGFIDHVTRNGGGSEDRPKTDAFKMPDEIFEGERNNVMFQYGCSLREKGRNDEEIFVALVGANLLHCKPPLPESEIKSISKSACKYEPGQNKDDTPNSGKSGSKKQSKNNEVDPNEPWRGPRGILHHVLAEHLIADDRACLIGGAPAIWNGSRWDIGVDAIERACIRHAQDITSAKRGEVQKYLMLNAGSLDIYKDFEQRPYVQFLNGTFDVDCKKVDPTPDMLIANTIPIEFDADAEDPVADDFIRSISNGDLPTQRLLKQVIASCLCSLRVVDQAVMLIGRTGHIGGEASNGKSTFLNMLKALLGTVDNVVSLDIKALSQPFQRQYLVGKLANLGDDIPNGFLQGDELATFKQAVTGDTIFADVKGGKGFNFTPTATLIFSMNEVPKLGDTSEGIFRRLSFLPFRKSYKPGDPDYDPGIISKLTTKTALQRFALLGMQELSRLDFTRHFDSVPDMAEELDTIRQDNDTVLRWVIEEQIALSDILGRVEGRGCFRSSNDVYDMYTDWAKKSGEKFTVTQSTFSRRLKRIFASDMLSVEATKANGRSVRCYTIGKT